MDRNDSIRSAMKVLTGAVQAIVSKPELVCVEEQTLKEVTILLLQVAPEDLAAVHGKDGRTFQSLNTVVSAFSERAMHDIKLEIAQQTNP